MNRRFCECTECHRQASRSIYGVRCCTQHENEVRLNLVFLAHLNKRGVIVYARTPR